MRYFLVVVLLLGPMSAWAHEDDEQLPIGLSLGLESALTADEAHTGFHIGLMAPLVPDLQFGLHTGFTVFTDRLPAPMIGSALEWTINPRISIVAMGELTLVQPAPEAGLAAGIEFTFGEYFGGSLAGSVMLGQHWLIQSAYSSPAPAETMIVFHLHLVIGLLLP